MNHLSLDFKEFISPDCQRRIFVQNHLNQLGLDAPVISLNGKNHIYVKFPHHQYDKKYRIKTVIAHYDRFESSPGANDNSSSVVSMLEWASRLLKKESPHNVRMIFTDGEECSSGIKSQGAYDLGKIFRQLNIVDDYIFVFDCMGRGTVPVLCQSNHLMNASADFLSRYKKIELECGKILTCAAGGFVRLPADYSDNAGFIANGIPAVAVTMLPEKEVSLYKEGLKKLKESTECNRSEEINFMNKMKENCFFRFFPDTWKMFHTKDDCIENLDEKSFDITAKILDCLGDFRFA